MSLAVARHVLVAYRLVFILFGAAMAVLWGVVAVLQRVTDVGELLPTLLGSPPKYFIFVLALVAAPVMLPSYVRFGVTRRAAFRGVFLAFGLVALVLCLGIAVGTLVGVPAEDRASLLTEVSLMIAIWTPFGWTVGAGYYRWGVWRGTAFLVPAAVPAVIAELLSSPRTEGWPLVATVAAAVACAGAALAGAYGIARRIPITNPQG